MSASDIINDQKKEPSVSVQRDDKDPEKLVKEDQFDMNSEAIMTFITAGIAALALILIFGVYCILKLRKDRAILA